MRIAGCLVEHMDFLFMQSLSRGAQRRGSLCNSHREERSDAAIHKCNMGKPQWIASLRSMTGLDLCRVFLGLIQMFPKSQLIRMFIKKLMQARAWFGYFFHDIRQCADGGDA